MTHTERPVIISTFSPPALACIRSWGRNGYYVGMICIRSDKEAHPASRHLASHCSIFPKQLFTTEGIQIIDDFLKSFKATGIIAINEKVACWINDNRQHLNSSVNTWAPSNNIALGMLSKIRQIEIAQHVGFDILPTHLIGGNAGEIGEIPQSHYPLCLRPDGPNTISPSFKVRIVHNSDELRQCIRQLNRIDSPMIAQPFANLPNLVIHGARTISGKTIGLQAFLVMRKFQGVTLTLRPIPISRDLLFKCATFAAHADLAGNFHFEFLLDRHSSKAYFLEINVRLGGTTAKVYACGYDEPMLALNAYGIQFGYHNKLSTRTVTGKHALIKYCLHALTGRLSRLDYPEESVPVRILKSMFGLAAYRDEVFAFSDIRGSIAFYYSLMRFKHN